MKPEDKRFIVNGYAEYPASIFEVIWENIEHADDPNCGDERFSLAELNALNALKVGETLTSKQGGTYKRTK